MPSVCLGGGLFAVTWAILGWLLFYWAHLERRKLTPLWQDIPCNTTESKLEFDSTKLAQYISLGWVNTSGYTARVCENKNYITIETVSYKNGTVSVFWPKSKTNQPGDITEDVGDPDRTLLKVGQQWTPRSYFKAHDLANVKSMLAIQLATSRVLEIMQASEPTMIVTTMHLRSTTRLIMMNMKRESIKESDSTCGFLFKVALKIIPGKPPAVEQVVGPVSCDTSYELMKTALLPVDAPYPIDEIALSDKDKAAVELAKDLFCGFMGFVGLMICSCFASCSCCCFRRWYKLSKNIHLKRYPPGADPSMYTGKQTVDKWKKKTQVEKNLALVQCAKYGKADVISVLLQAGAGVNSQDNGGRRPITEAAMFSNLDTIRALIQAGADATAPDGGGRTALDLVRMLRQPGWQTCEAELKPYFEGKAEKVDAALESNLQKE